MRGDALGRNHVLGDALPHRAHGLHLVVPEIDLLARHRGFQGDVRQPSGHSGCGARWRRRCRRPGRRGWSGVRRRSRGRHTSCGDHRLDVLFADAPACARAPHGSEIDSMFLGHPAHERRAVNAAPVLRRGCGRSGRNRRCRSGGSRSRRRGRCRSSSSGSFRSRSGSFRLCRSRRRRCSRRACRVNHAHNRLNRHGLPFADLDLLQHAGRRRGNFRVHFVRGNFK